MKKIILPILLLCLVIQNCKNDAVEEPAPTTTTTSDSVYADAYAILMTITNVNYIYTPPLPAMEQKASVIQAYFGISSNTTPYADAGTVTLDTTTLNYSTNGTYYPSNNGSGWFFEQLSSASSLVWDVSGNTSSGVPATNDDIGAIPIVDSINSASVIQQGTGYNLTCINVLNADSTIFTLKGNSGSAVIRRQGSVSDVLFDNVMVGQLGIGQMSASVKAKSLITKTVGGKKYYFIKEANYTKMNMVVQ